MSLTTEFSFTLPRGYLGSDGTVHRRGVMRLATARDEIEPLRDPRVQGADDPYLTIIVLSRVVTELGSLSAVTPREIENLFAADLAFLQDLYGVVNFAKRGKGEVPGTSPAEQAEAERLLARHSADYRREPAAARALLGTGQLPVPTAADPVEVAALLSRHVLAEDAVSAHAALRKATDRFLASGRVPRLGKKKK